MRKIIMKSLENINDFLRKAKRGPAVITQKDIGDIIAFTGCTHDWKVVDAGSGSGFLSLFLGNLGCKVYTYEKEERFFDIASANIKKAGFKNVKIKNADITKGIKEKDVDLVTLDMKNPERVVGHAFKALKSGGYLVVYSMHIEQIQDLWKEVQKYEFGKPKILEKLQREWQIEGDTYTRPKTQMLAHTGFLTFIRKI
ncbi:MAG: methyltransferase domain-containing protein [Candidatus Aenigmarchaeota archaeon]|nr:methyltransferase domain-containing protein [Candidatus Aenigmarchaeota archaeon]